MSDTPIGKLLNENAQRDAIHVAIAPVVAAERLYPGEDVGLTIEGTATSSEAVKKIGIVDPFLRQKFIATGERFYIFLYPNTVTGMRHHWEHPAFKEQVIEKQPTGVEESIEWLKAYAARHNSYDSPEEAYARLLECMKSGDLFFHGSDLHGFYDLDDAEELKEHAQKVLGIKIDFNRFTFSCSC